MIKQPTYKLTDPNSGRHLYGRGWLGLIPLIGAFVGIGLIVLGIFKYKDRKIVVIGIAALLFTVAIYGGLFYYSQYSTTGVEMKKQLAQDILNNLVKDIEFYKQQHSDYPDSLQQVKATNRLVLLNDPMSHRMFGEIKDLQYRKSDEGYILFSVGEDMKPNTGDDIYPTIQLKKSDSVSHERR
jgi:hypothetical protein